ncbi:MAG: PQQ-binding-like beta-propeller repeat protein, partial [Lentisphaerae bacterium]|nr:PQQ-binding-like beta-propeller repeat protein [Lentisphaerota bacterium]
EESGLVKSGGGANKADTLTALDMETGKTLWTGKHAPSGYSSPEDLFVINGVVWSGATSGGGLSGEVTGRDIHTGEVKGQFKPDVDTYWFHHRCHRGKATDRFLMTSRTGIEFISPTDQNWNINHWVRGGCMYGIMPANGLVYAPPHDCACYPETKQFGFSVLAAASASRAVPRDIPDAGRLERGPAYGAALGAASGEAEWSTFRGDERRSGWTPAAVPAALTETWSADLGGTLSTAVVAAGRLFISSIDDHTVFSLDGGTGEVLWQRTVGGVVDSPPTVYRGLALFGAADGYVYCLRAADGEMVWRFRAAPIDRRQMAFQRIESLWPVHGSVLVEDGVLYCVAGRSMFLDGGLRFLKLDPATGRKLAEVVLDERDPESEGDLHAHVKWLNMPVALPDVLSSDDQYVYMRSQRFDRDGKRHRLGPRSKDRFQVASDQHGEGLHLFSPSGFLDGSWFHRSYWVHAVTFAGGWNGYFLGGKYAPAGRILTMDNANVYGFGRKPKYYKWTTQIEHQLFAAPKDPPSPDRKGGSAKGTAVWIENSASLDPSGKPLTVTAWVKAGKKADGVVISRGGPIHGYALVVNKGRPEFHLRADKALTKVVAKGKISGQWVHLAGAVTAAKEVRFYVDGKLAATGRTKSLIPKNPAQATQIGIDDQGAVGDYRSPFGFTGVIDDVRVYHRALTPEELKQHVVSPAAVPKQQPELVLCMSFDNGKAPDESGNKNAGRVEGPKPVKGKVGQAFQFRGKPGGGGYYVKHQWTRDMPVHVRAMALTGSRDKVLFVAGPPDLVDEEDASRRFAEPETQAQLLEQEQAMLGKRGATLIAVSATDGRTLAELQLDSSPVWDGLISANGKLFLATEDGKVLCLGTQE